MRPIRLDEEIPLEQQINSVLQDIQLPINLPILVVNEIQIVTRLISKTFCGPRFRQNLAA